MLMVYFEDGPLVKDIRWRLYPQINIDAADGVSDNLAAADKILEASKGTITVVYTNQILLLNSKYTYFDKGNRFCAYLRDKDNSWMNIGFFTDRELRPGHNVPKLYLAGEFTPT